MTSGLVRSEVRGYVRDDVREAKLTATVHHGQATRLHAQRAHVLTDTYARTPERFVRQPRRPPALPTTVWINKPTTQEVAH